MKIFVVTADAIVDIAGEMIHSGFVVGAFFTEADAQKYIDAVDETYMHKRSDYTITSIDIEGENND